MSTNFYFRSSPEQDVDDALHIGLSAGGYFTFRVYTHASKRLTSYDAWMKFLSSSQGDIVNEYGHVVSLDDFKRYCALDPKDQQRLVFSNSPVLRAGEPVKQGMRYRDEQGYLFENAAFS